MVQGAVAVSPLDSSSFSRGKKTDAIIESLRQDIVTGRLKRGERLPNERELAAHFDVSQPSVREAVRALDVMGLVDVRHGSGAYVRGDAAYAMGAAMQNLLQIENVSVLEALDVREMVGRESVRLACREAVGEDIDALEEKLEKLTSVADAGSVEEIVDDIVAFQVAVSIAAHNPLLFTIEIFLANLLLQIQIKAMRKRGTGFWSKRSLAFQGDRSAIVDAIKRRATDEALEAMQFYLEHQRSVFLADPEFAELRLSDAKAVRTATDLVFEARRLSF
jgi:GntR family transcriptional repressor for pyruvate dehydrogenase complex